MRDVFIVAAERTVIAPTGGLHRDKPFYELGAQTVRQVCQSIESQEGECPHPAFLMMGNAMAAGGNPARLVGLASDLSGTLPAFSVDTQCCSGLDAIGLAFERLRCMEHTTFAIAGGSESCSLAPIRANRRTQERYDEADFTPWPDSNPRMIQAAIHLQHQRGLSDTHLYDWAVRSHARNLENSLRPERDPFARELTTELCLRAASVKPYNPTLMAPLADGAAFVGLLVRDPSIDSPTDSALQILSYQTMGGDPLLPGLAVAGLKSWLMGCQRMYGFHLSELVVSLMESFCAQVLANIQDLGFSIDQVNPWGGMLARGHPIGASGAVLVCDLFDHLQPGQTGLAAIPAAGGIASGLLVRRLA